jgi:hypothetical protein
MDNKTVLAGHYHMTNDVQKLKHMATEGNETQK